MLSGIALFMLKIRFYCEIELKTGRRYTILGSREIIEKLWQDLSLNSSNQK